MRPFEIPPADLEIWTRHSSKHRPVQNLEFLEDSIRADGVVEPIMVIESWTSGKFTIVDGVRRFLVAKSIGLSTIPAEILEKTDMP